MWMKSHHHKRILIKFGGSSNESKRCFFIFSVKENGGEFVKHVIDENNFAVIECVLLF